MSGNEHVMAIREALKEAHALTFEGDTIGIRRVLSGPQNVYLDALNDEMNRMKAVVKGTAEAIHHHREQTRDAALVVGALNDELAEANARAERMAGERDFWKAVAVHHYEKRKEAEARAERLDDEALIELVAESMWRPIFGGNLAGQSFAERAPYLRSIWLRHAQHAVSAMRAFGAGDLDAAPGDTEGEAQP